jgi:serine/threonine protein kinase
MRDRYTITERLDHGGMAEVFRGVAESMEGFKKSVAIKRVLPNLTKNQKFVAMFLDEARRCSCNTPMSFRFSTFHELQTTPTSW